MRMDAYARLLGFWQGFRIMLEQEARNLHRDLDKIYTLSRLFLRSSLLTVINTLIIIKIFYKTSGLVESSLKML